MALHSSGKLRKNRTGDSMTNEMRESKMENARRYSSFSRISVYGLRVDIFGCRYRLFWYAFLFLPSIRIGTLVLKDYCGNNMIKMLYLEIVHIFMKNIVKNRHKFVRYIVLILLICSLRQFFYQNKCDSSQSRQHFPFPKLY